ncbi:granzyme A-like [Mantella aurantiaca]
MDEEEEQDTFAAEEDYSGYRRQRGMMWRCGLYKCRLSKLFTKQRICTDQTMKLFLLILSAMLLFCEGARMKIINGREAAPNSRPYMALIEFHSHNESIICGGSLITDRWVLTAAHCDKPEWRTTIILGAHSRVTKNNLWQEFHIETSIKHPHYNATDQNNDLRLIKLDKKAILTKAVKLLPLPTTFEDPEEESTCETAGWGITEKGKVADNLMEVNVTILERNKCAEYWKNFTVITKNVICTIVGPGGEDTCRGDSGGPLICKGVFTGITSFGNPVCGIMSTASVFTRLTEEYIRWIDKTLND